MPSLSLFTHAMLHIGDTPPKKFFIYKVGISLNTEISPLQNFHFSFKIIQRMARNINPNHFFFTSKFSMVPQVSQGGIRVLDLNITRFSKQTDLRRIFIFLITLAYLMAFSKKVTHRLHPENTVLGGCLKTIKTASIGQIFKCFFIGARKSIRFANQK